MSRSIKKNRMGEHESSEQNCLWWRGRDPDSPRGAPPLVPVERWKVPVVEGQKPEPEPVQTGHGARPAISDRQTPIRSKLLGHRPQETGEG
mgnify:CR=1 FL=1